MLGPPQTQETSKAFGAPGLVLRVLGSFLALSLLVLFTPVANVIQATTQVGIGTLVFVVATSTAIHVVTATKWGLLVRATGARLPFPTAISAHFAGLFANIWLPSIVGGDLIRATVAGRAAGKLSGPTAAGIVDRMLDLLALVTIATLALAFTPPAQGNIALHILEFGAAAATLGFLAAFITLRHFEPERWLPARISKALGHLKHAAQSLAGRGELWAVAFVVSIAAQSSLVGLNVLLGQAVGIELSFAAWAVAWCLAKVAAFAPVSLGGLGVREAALAGLLATFGVEPSLAVAQGLLWYGCLLAVGSIGGLSFLAVKPAPMGPEEAEPATH